MDEMCADARRASSALDPRVQVQDRIPWFRKFLGQYSRSLSFEFGVLGFEFADTPLRRLAPLGHGVLVRRGVAPGCVMLQLALDVSQQARCAKSEQLRFHPVPTKFFFHQN